MSSGLLRQRAHGAVRLAKRSLATTAALRDSASVAVVAAPSRDQSITAAERRRAPQAMGAPSAPMTPWSAQWCGSRPYSTDATGTPPTVKREFQAETRKLLQIVANSLYSEKEVFLRELVSNASDALEKLRHAQVNNEAVVETEKPLEIHLTTNELEGTLTIADTGIGMNEEELVKNLGTIAHSGSKAFLEKLQSGNDSASNAKDNIIGQFGVGFYSAFMVADKIAVETRSAKGDTPGFRWESDGAGSYEIATLDDKVARGTRITLHLKDGSKDFIKKFNIESVIQKYSNFVGFPIFLNGTKINTMQPLWLLKKDEVTTEQHNEFYRFLSKATDEPRYILQYSADAPLNLRTLLYVPKRNMERTGMNRTEPGVNLYARKVLIQAKSRALLPDWLRFLRGACDSEDIPLNLSREMLQDSALISRLRNVITGRVIKWLAEEATSDHDNYIDFYHEFGAFIKEGACTDQTHKDKIAKLLRFPSSQARASDPDSANADDTGLNMTSLQEYVDRMKPGQKGVYFLMSSSKEAALASPYYEPFKQTGTEVLFVFDPVDEFVFNNLREFAGKEFINIDSEHVDVVADRTDVKLSEAEIKDLQAWLQKTLSHTLSQVNVSKRLVSHPAMIVGHESATMRQMLRMLDPNIAASMKNRPRGYKMEINPSHPVIVALATAAKQTPAVAEIVARQVLDNAMIAAGAMDDPRTMLVQLNQLMEVALGLPPTPTSAAHSEPLPDAKQT